ncbi:RAI1 like PD-(D/E)XK nuclease domain-containing protein [Ditylenchus destructor]|nr:RAI1 like PD-(D/E)XK nuclease domain-containing protein [Ditylenchus destructor]
MKYGTISANPHKYFSDWTDYPNITRVSEFSLDEQRNHTNDERASARYLLKKYSQTSILKEALDLRAGYSSWVPNSRGDKFRHIQRWIASTAQWGATLEEVVDAEIVVNRGTLERIAISPFELRHGIKLVCRKYKGVIFMTDFNCPTRAHKEALMAQCPQSRAQEYGDHKFEQLISSPDQSGVCDSWQPVNSKVEFYAVLNADFDDGNQYTEAKTQAHGLHVEAFHKKVLHWWLQTYLATVDRIVIGIRNSMGMVEKIEYMNTNSLWNYSKKGKADICFVFLKTCLKTIRNIMADLSESDVLIVECEAGSDDFNFNVINEDENIWGGQYDIVEDFLKKRFTE